MQERLENRAKAHGDGAGRSVGAVRAGMRRSIMRRPEPAGRESAALSLNLVSKPSRPRPGESRPAGIAGGLSTKRETASPAPRRSPLLGLVVLPLERMAEAFVRV